MYAVIHDERDLLPEQLLSSVAAVLAFATTASSEALQFLMKLKLPCTLVGLRFLSLTFRFRAFPLTEGAGVGRRLRFLNELADLVLVTFVTNRLVSRRMCEFALLAERTIEAFVHERAARFLVVKFLELNVEQWWHRRISVLAL